MDALDAFDASRIAGSILGMGDVVGLVERAQQVVEEEDAEKLAKKMMKGEFTLEDMVDQFRKIRQMGSLEGILGMLPGAKNIKQQMAGANVDDKMLSHQEAIILAMTPKERRNPKSVKWFASSAYCNGFRHDGAGSESCAQATQANVTVYEESWENGEIGQDAWSSWLAFREWEADCLPA